MAKTYQQILEEARRSVAEVTADEVQRVQKGGQGTAILDVREKDEFRDGHLSGAISLPRGFLEMQVEAKVPDKQTPIITYCQSGVRSLLAGRILKEMGYTNVRSMGGGFGA